MAELFQMTEVAKSQNNKSASKIVPAGEEKTLFTKQCGASGHVYNKVPLLNLKTGKKVKRKTVDAMLNQSMISKKTKYVCQECVQKVEGSYNYSPEQTDTKEEKLPITGNVTCDNTCTSSVTDEVLDHIKSDIIQLYNDNEKCSISKLLAFDAESWLNERPKCLVRLLRKLCGLDSTIQKVDHLKLAKIIEIIYGCRNKNIILPLSFQENLLVFSLSRNKQLVNYNSKMSPAGCDKSITCWLLQQADSPVSFPEGLVRSVFDNEQVIGKSYRIKTDSKIPSSIVTSHMYVVIDETNHMQNDETFCPKNWLFMEPTIKQKETFMSTCDHKTGKVKIRVTRNSLIEDRLKSILNDRDCVNVFLSEKAKSLTEKVCIDCGGENEKKSRKCTNCGGLLTSEYVQFEQFANTLNPYKHFRHENTVTNNITVKTGEPDLLNPSSFENISEILHNLGSRSGVIGNGDRKWLFIECDGGIYSIVEKLLFNVFSCLRCNEAFYGMEAYLEHRCNILYNEQQMTHEFGWIIPMPGLLHIEINACKAFFQLNWEVFMQVVCIELGFKTPKSLECARKCTDHHKAFKILEILYIAMVDELLFPFIEYCKNETIDATTEQYWNWSDSQVKNPIYMYCQQMAFTFLHAIMLFRVGCRRGNIELILAGRQKMSLLFFCRKHPRYQRIIAMNSFIETMMPDALKDTMMKSWTFSRTGNKGHYQGGDACLEEINREAKSWVSPVGVPSEEDWVKVFRNLDALCNIKQSLLEPSQSTGTVINESSINMKEVVPVRALFRLYLAQPTLEVPHTSICGNVQLSPHLYNITAEAEAIRRQYYSCFISGEQVDVPVIHVTEEESRNALKVENLSKEDIRKKIFMLLENMPEKDRKLMEDVYNKTVKTKTKVEYIAFYYTLLEDSVVDSELQFQ